LTAPVLPAWLQPPADPMREKAVAAVLAYPALEQLGQRACPEEPRQRLAETVVETAYVGGMLYSDMVRRPWAPVRFTASVWELGESIEALLTEEGP
jgi:hypothetical protein